MTDPLSRALHVDLSTEWRGGQQQLRLLLREAPPVAAIVAEGSPVERALVEDGVRVLAVRVARFSSPAGAVARAVDRLRGEGAALVAAHDRDGAAAALAARLALPVVVHRRVDFAPSRCGARRYRQAAGVVAVSQAVAQVLRARGVRRIAVVPDGVDPAPVRSAAPDRAGVLAALGLRGDVPLVLALGALVQHKGHRVLVEAMPLLPHVAVVILGEGPLRSALWQRARRLGVADRLFLPGWRPDAARWLRSADAFAHPSLEEGLGQAVIEADLAGLPVVASRAGGLPELGIGALVPPGDRVALAEALRAALAAPRAAPGPGLPLQGRSGPLLPLQGRSGPLRFTVRAMAEGTARAYAAWARGP